MSYVDKNLIPWETVLYRTGLYWSVLFVPVLIAVLLAASGLGLLFGSTHEQGDGARVMMIAGGVLLVAALISLVAGVLRRNATEIAVSNKRVLIKTGFGRRRRVELLLLQVESIVVNEPLAGRMMGYGTVTVRGTGGTPEPFDRIAHPLEFRRQVQHQIELSHSSEPTASPRG